MHNAQRIRFPRFLLPYRHTDARREPETAGN